MTLFLRQDQLAVNSWQHALGGWLSYMEFHKQDNGQINNFELNTIFNSFTKYLQKYIELLTNLICCDYITMLYESRFETFNPLPPSSDKQVITVDWIIDR